MGESLDDTSEESDLSFDTVWPYGYVHWVPSTKELLGLREQKFQSLVDDVPLPSCENSVFRVGETSSELPSQRPLAGDEGARRADFPEQKDDFPKNTSKAVKSSDSSDNQTSRNVYGDSVDFSRFAPPRANPQKSRKTNRKQHDDKVKSSLGNHNKVTSTYLGKNSKYQPNKQVGGRTRKISPVSAAGQTQARMKGILSPVSSRTRNAGAADNSGYPRVSAVSKVVAEPRAQKSNVVRGSKGTKQSILSPKASVSSMNLQK